MTLTQAESREQIARAIHDAGNAEGQTRWDSNFISHDIRSVRYEQADAVLALTALERRPWSKVADAKPRPHARYTVRRDGNTHTATPCYGMHAPWWVPVSIDGVEYDPTTMLDTDEWLPLIADESGHG